MNKYILKYSFLFVVLILVQILIFNHFNLTEYHLNPFVYILFILLFPIEVNKSLFIFLCFLLGLSVDMFSNSGGMHAAASLLIGFIRPVILKFSFGVSYEFHQLKIASSELGARITYFSILIIVHHLVLFFQDYLSFSHILRILLLTLYNSLLTLIFVILLTILFKRRVR